jgi:sugar phosphate isomerase/epimerase
MTTDDQFSCNRRAFLSRAASRLATAAALPALGPRLAGGAPAQQSEPWKMRLSGSTINFTKLPVEEAIAKFAELGFDAVDVWSGHAGCPHLDDVLDRLGPEGLKEVLAKNKLELYSFSVYRGGYRKYAELLGRSGGGVAVRGSAGACPPEELTTRMKQFLEAMKPDLELAEQHDSYLAIENHGHALLDSLDSFKAFTDLNKSPRLGIALAPYHLQGLGVSIEEAIEVAGDQLLYFYAWQRGPGEKQLPGEGPTDCTPWIAALAKIKYRWYVNPFMHHEPEPETMAKLLAKSVAYLKECYAKATS